MGNLPTFALFCGLLWIGPSSARFSPWRFRNEESSYRRGIQSTQVETGFERAVRRVLDKYFSRQIGSSPWSSDSMTDVEPRQPEDDNTTGGEAETGHPSVPGEAGGEPDEAGHVVAGGVSATDKGPTAEAPGKNSPVVVGGLHVQNNDTMVDEGQGESEEGVEEEGTEESSEQQGGEEETEEEDEEEEEEEEDTHVRKKGCLLDGVEIPHEYTFKVDCNYCICYNGMLACTLIHCD